MLSFTTSYKIEYELSALIFLAIIISRYFGARRFPNQKNHIFAFILWTTALDMILDIVSSFVIDNALAIPEFVTYAINTAFYALQILLPVLMTMYALVLSRYISKASIPRLIPIFIPSAVALLALLANPLTKWFFYVDSALGYMHGSGFISLYITLLIYIIATFVIAYANRKRMQKAEFGTICKFLLIVFISVAAQFMYPKILVSGVAIAVAVILMYFTIQNPDSMVDSATGAFTYEAMQTFLSDRAQARDMIQLVAIKINNIPRINELLGISNGTLLLRQLCGLLRESAANSWVFRMRGGCFVAITNSADDYHKLRDCLEKRAPEAWVIGGVDVLLQATICCAAINELLPEPPSPEETINYLETVFIQNERAGSRIKTVTIGRELLDKIRRKTAVESALRKALESGEGLELHFQPIYSVKEKRFESAEALLRFRHPSLGSIPPSEFVPIAESSGFVTAMDEFVIRRACEFIRSCGDLRNLGLKTLQINISALEFMQRRLPEMIDEITAQYRVNPASLCFEITETAATESYELLRECMQDIRKTGCRFALDDFGTGYANISQVIQLPFSMVKLDRSLLGGPDIVVEDLAHMFRHMDCLTVIEGVETKEQVDLTTQIDIEYIQGFYYARPMPAKDFTAFLKASGEQAG
ncbi:MAG: EAL domain-containing protein [Eubacteriales bacterium]|nr:EAL domain-containing protein [Eubacteriales bacterium]